jgi:hypothetical protein
LHQYFIADEIPIGSWLLGAAGRRGLRQGDARDNSYQGVQSARHECLSLAAEGAAHELRLSDVIVGSSLVAVNP